MKCDKFQAFLPDMLLDPTRAAADARVEAQQHLLECSRCQTEWRELQATMQLLDAWEAPEPSAYFDTRMAARLREEKSVKAGWLERMHTRMLLGNNLHLRPALAAAFALLLIVGAGSYEEYVSLNKPQPARQTVSATVKDLELFDSNAQTLEQLAAFDSTDAAVGQSSTGNSSN